MAVIRGAYEGKDDTAYHHSISQEIREYVRRVSKNVDRCGVVFCQPRVRSSRNIAIIDPHHLAELRIASYVDGAQNEKCADEDQKPPVKTRRWGLQATHEIYGDGEYRGVYSYRM